ncbi:hypothetical protein VTO42DRAFT_4674 [Malbranchea cinnamomea]
MLSRSGFGRNAAQAISRQCFGQARRGMATAKGFEYEASEAAGVKLATRDIPGPTTTLSVIAKAGSRYQPLPGFSDALAKFAFKSTTKRSGLRITRESELLGGELSSYHSRENLVLTARFFNSDLPYYAELLAEVLKDTRYIRHELEELVLQNVRYAQDGVAANPAAQAWESVHSVAFHRGLGNPLVPPPTVSAGNYVDAESLAAFAKGAYAKPSIAVVASGSNSSADVSKWVGQFFQDIPATPASSPYAPVADQPTKYFGGEERTNSTAGNTIVIGFPGSSTFGTAGYKPEFSVLAALLGGESSIKWSPGSSILAQAAQNVPGVRISTKQATYSDTGLLYITVAGKSAAAVGQAAKQVVDAVNKVASGNITSEDVKKAAALARFRALESGQNLTTGIELTGSALIHGTAPFQIAQIGESIGKVTEQQVKEAAKSLLSGKASVATVGDLSTLPYASELGLTV